MTKTLILTGWGPPDYACAAAVALRAHPNANVLGMSKGFLPEFLNEVSGFDKILILGIGLESNPKRLEEGLARLKKQKVDVLWISVFSNDLSADAAKNLTQIVREVGSGRLTESAADYFKVHCNDLLPICKDNSKNKSIRSYHTLIKAARFAFCNYHNIDAYTRVIEYLAKGIRPEAWSQKDRELVTHYERFGSRELLGKSEQMRSLREKIKRIAPHENARVLIYGESGTGKENVAFTIHYASPRKEEAYIAFNCATATNDLLESRLFGHEKGAFTGAHEKRLGVFEEANGGTLFLDEIGEMPLEVQGILLRVLEVGRFSRIGSNTEIAVNVRLIAATNQNLPKLVREGKFRADLFHRLNVIHLRTPPLREHKGDIEQIANSFRRTRNLPPLNTAQIDALMQYDYPGNVRELLNLLERANVLGINDFGELIEEHKQMLIELDSADSPTSLSAGTAFCEYPDNLDEATRLHVRRVYAKYGNNASKTADALGISRNTAKKHLKS